MLPEARLLMLLTPLSLVVKSKLPEPPTAVLWIATEPCLVLV